MADQPPAAVKKRIRREKAWVATFEMIGAVAKREGVNDDLINEAVEKAAGEHYDEFDALASEYPQVDLAVDFNPIDEIEHELEEMEFFQMDPLVGILELTRDFIEHQDGPIQLQPAGVAGDE